MTATKRRGSILVTRNPAGDMISPHEKEAPYISEGICPVCLDERLNVQEHAVTGEVAGVCPGCGIGWALRPSTEDEAWMGPMVTRCIYEGPWRARS